MIDNTIITKFELSDREKMLKRQFFKRDEQSGKKYLFSRPLEDNQPINNQSYIMNNSESLYLDKNQNSKLSNQNNNISCNEKLVNNNITKNIKDSQNLSNQRLSNSIPEIQNISQEDMNKFYEEAANYLPKANGGMSPEQINLLLHQNKIMQRNVDALQETNRSLQDFIIYTIKKDSMKNKSLKEVNGQVKKNIEYEKLNKLLTPLYEHINNLQSEVKELNQKRREDEINVELDDLIIKNQRNVKQKYMPQNISGKNRVENEKNNKIMMKTLSSLKGTMTNMTEEMKKIGNTFNEKMQKVLEDTEKNKLKNIVGGRANSTVKNSKICLGAKSMYNGQSNNINVYKDNGNNQNESLLKNKLDNIDYEIFKSDLIDIGHLKDAIVSEYNSGIPEFPKLTKPKSKIKFSYNLDKELNNIMNKVNNRSQSISKFNLNDKVKNSKSKMKERVSNIINNEKSAKSSKNISSNKKPYEHTNNKSNIINNNNYNYNNINDNNEEIDHDNDNKNKELNQMSVIDKMNLYTSKMAQLSGNYEVKEKNDKKLEYNPESLNPMDNNYANDLNSNHSGVTNQKFNKPSFENKNRYNPPKVKYGVFHGQKGIPHYHPNLNLNEESNKILMPEIVLPGPDKINNEIKNKIDDYLLAAFKNLKPSEAPQINLNNEINKKNNTQNTVERVIEREYITKNIKEVQNIPQPIVINPPQQNMEQNNELIDKFINLTEKFTNLEEKISKQILEQKKTEKKIEIIEKKEKPERKPEPPEKKVILPNVNLISQLVIDKIKKTMNIDINRAKQQREQPEIINKVEVQPKVEEEKKEEEIDIFDINQKTKMEDLDDIIRMPHKINLDEYEVSQTSSYLSESLQKNNLNLNSNNQIIINNKNIRIENYNETNINEDNNENDDNSKSMGEISRDANSSVNENINKEKNNKTGIDLLNLKNINEQFQNQLKYIKDNNSVVPGNNVINIPNIETNNYNMCIFIFILVYV